MIKLGFIVSCILVTVYSNELLPQTFAYKTVGCANEETKMGRIGIDCVKINNDYIKVSCVGEDKLWLKYHYDSNCVNVKRRKKQIVKPQLIDKKDNDKRIIDFNCEKESTVDAASTEDTTQNEEQTNDVGINAGELESSGNTHTNGDIAAAADIHDNKEQELGISLFRQMWTGLFGRRNGANGVETQQISNCVRECRLNNLRCCGRRSVTCLCQCCACICGTENERINDAALTNTGRDPLLGNRNQNNPNQGS